MCDDRLFGDLRLDNMNKLCLKLPSLYEQIASCDSKNEQYHKHMITERYIDRLELHEFCTTTIVISFSFASYLKMS